MKVVIADTSPLNYLILVDAVDILPRLYGRVTIPDVVWIELTSEDAPPQVTAWAATRPGWIEVRPVPASEDSSLRALDPGERAAILLAQQQTRVLLLMDDASGRLEATKRGILTTGTLGVLRAASLQKLISLPEVLTRLRATNFRVSSDLLNDLIAEYEQWTKSGEKP
jgi:predicted nucleic acid-binding protein